MNFLQTSMIVAGVILLGRISGFLREIIIAQVSGASLESDVAIVLLTFPDMMISLLLGGGLTAALVPSFRSLPSGAGFALFLGASLLAGVFFGFLALVIALFPTPILGIVAPGWSQDLVTQNTPLFRITLIALPVLAFSGVVTAFLNSKERFIFGAIGTLVFNFSLISMLLLFDRLSPSVAVVMGILSGVVLRLAVQLTASRRFWSAPDFSMPYDINGLMRRFCGGFGFFSILTLLPPIARAYASLIEPGALSIFNYAYKLMALPMAVIVAAIITVLLPRLSGHVRNKEHEQADNVLGTALRAVSILLLGIAVATVFQAEAVVRIVYFGAAFTAEQLHELGMVVSLGFVGLPFQGLVLFYGTAFVSYDRTGTLVKVSILMIVVMASVAFYLQSIWGVEGLMFAYVLSQAAGALMLTIGLFRFTGIGPFVIAFNRPFLSVFLPMAVCMALSWFFREINFWGLPALLLSAGAFFAINVGADPKIIKSIKNRQVL